MLRKYGMKIEYNLELVLLDEWNARWLYEFRAKSVFLYGRRTAGVKMDKIVFFFEMTEKSVDIP